MCFNIFETNMSHFHPLEVVGRDSETQLLGGICSGDLYSKPIESATF